MLSSVWFFPPIRGSLKEKFVWPNACVSAMIEPVRLVYESSRDRVAVGRPVLFSVTSRYAWFEGERFDHKARYDVGGFLGLPGTTWRIRKFWEEEILHWGTDGDRNGSGYGGAHTKSAGLSGEAAHTSQNVCHAGVNNHGLRATLGYIRFVARRCWQESVHVDVYDFARWGISAAILFPAGCPRVR